MEAVKRKGRDSKHSEKPKKRKRRHSSSCSSSELSDREDSTDSSEYKRSHKSKKKRKHSHKEPKVKKHNHNKKRSHHDSIKKEKPVVARTTEVTSVNRDVPPPPPASKSRGPMTREDYEKQQSVVRRVLDPETGRHRLVKGDGEIVEEIVSRDRHKAINKLATLGDGLSFQSGLKKFQ
ncbi:ADP-ribosylation factor-like protein 6-interacting protein 4 [Halichondria panicea]|uniref:ADP-ribosylation factor-like protein 6-interacting protein 4 n=1 Tax=Halichondria panicea TaxID=6063 RepID=UPI00312B84E2